MPYLPQTTRVFVEPKNYLERIGNLADDGSFYRVIFAQGEYPYTLPFILTTGGMAIESHVSHGAIFYPGPKEPPLSASRVYTFRAPDVRIHGVVFKGQDYGTFEYPAAEYDSLAVRSYTAQIGGNPEYTGQKPDYIELGEVRQEGYGVIGVFPSIDPNNPSEVIVQDHVNDRTGHNSSFSIYTNFDTFPYPAGDGVRMDCRIINYKGYGINGPDGPGAVNPQDILSSHRNGCASLEIWRLGTGTRVNIEGARLEAHIYGSRNHDLHCTRVHFLSDPDIEIYYKDVDFLGHWHEGSMLGDGGGAPYLGYYHSTNGVSTFAHVQPNLPLIDFTNCRFKQILPEVRDENPNMIMYSAGSPGRYNFNDCSFEFVDPTGTYPAGLRKDVDIYELSHGNVEVNLNNCIRSSSNPPLNGYASGVPDPSGHVWYENSTTLQFGPDAWPGWNRGPTVSAAAFTSVTPTITNPTFTGSTGWTLTGSASTTGNYLNLIGSMTGFGGFESRAQQTITFPAHIGGRYALKARVQQVLLDDASRPLRFGGVNFNPSPALEFGRWYPHTILGYVTIAPGDTSILLDLYQRAPTTVGQTNVIYIDNLALVQV